MAGSPVDAVPVNTAAYRILKPSAAPEPEAPGLHNGMVPITFDGCFGWFHPGRANHLPVLLCAPLGREARWTHRTYRKLASRLAAAGLPVLRFDYPGTGDSCELPPDADPVAAWLDSVHSAANWVRVQTGAQHVVMAGLRFGATLAANAAAARQDVAALILLAPVVSGRAYVRELKTMARMGEAAREGEPIELDGLVLTDRILQTLAKIALPHDTVPERILVLEHGPRTKNSYSDIVAGLGADVTTLPFDGYADLMINAVMNKVPLAILAQITDWLVPGNIAIGTNDPAVAPSWLAPRLCPQGCIEQPVTFGTGHRLFGMICRPDDRPTGAIVIIGNSGGDPHTGIGRFAVTLARSLAARGIASFRMDYAGLGDSLLGMDDQDGHVYTTDRRADIAAAIDVLAPLGFTQFGTFGLCTGAYHSLSATVADARISSVAMINLATFKWHETSPMEMSPTTHLRATASYRKGLLNLKIWQRILQGDVAMRIIASVMLRRALDRTVLTSAYAAERFGLSKGAAKRPRNIMRALSKRGVKILMVLSSEDPGIDALEAHFGPKGRVLADLPGAVISIQAGLDHTLSRQHMRDDAVRIMTNFSVDAWSQMLQPERPDHSAGRNAR